MAVIDVQLIRGASYSQGLLTDRLVCYGGDPWGRKRRRRSGRRILTLSPSVGKVARSGGKVSPSKSEVRLQGRRSRFGGQRPRGIRVRPRQRTQRLRYLFEHSQQGKPMAVGSSRRKIHEAEVA